MINFCYFDESMPTERIANFVKFYELTQIEDNFPFKLCAPSLFAHLI